MKLNFYKIIIFLIPLFLLGCNSGENPLPNKNQDQTMPIALTKKNNVKLINYNTINITQLKIQDRQARSKQIIYNFNSRFPNNQISQDIIYSTIGWNSSIQDFAPMSCWNYNLTLSNHDFTSNSYYTQNGSSLALGFGFQNSIASKFLEETSNEEISFNSLYTDRSTAINIGTTAYSRVIVNIEISGLNSNGQNILNNDPAEFSYLCGDKILTSLPVIIQASYLLNYHFESASLNEQGNIKISNEVGVGGDFVKDTTTLNQSTITNNSSVSINQNLYTQGAIDVNTLKEVDLSPCTQNNESSAGKCTAALQLLSDATEAGYSSAESLLMAEGGENIAWEAMLATDYSRSGYFKYQDTNQELLLLGKTIINNNPAFNQYESVIIQNLDVLQDLYTAQHDLQNIGAAIINLPSDFVLGWVGYSSNSQLANVYANALVPVIGNFQPDLLACMNSTSTADIDTNCAKLTLNASVTNEFNKFATISNPTLPNVKSLVLETIKTLVYNDNVTRGVTTVNSNVTLLTASVNSYMVYLPSSNAIENLPNASILITLPKNPNQLIAEVDGIANTPVYISAWEYMPDGTFWDDWTKDPFWFEPTYQFSGQIGYYDGELEILEGSDSLPDSVTTSNGGSDLQCTPFQPYDDGSCIYNVFIQFINYNDPPTNIETINQIIHGTYDPSLAPNASNIFGSNKFATLYSGK